MINTSISYNYNINISTRSAAEAAYQKYCLKFYREVSLLFRQQYAQIGAPIVWENYSSINCPPNVETSPNTPATIKPGLSEVFKVVPEGDAARAFHIKVEYVLSAVGSYTANNTNMSPNIQIYTAKTEAGLASASDIRTKTGTPVGSGYYTTTTNGLSAYFHLNLTNSFISWGISAQGKGSTWAFISPLHNPITGLPTTQLAAGVFTHPQVYNDFNLQEGAFAYGRQLTFSANYVVTRLTLIDTDWSARSLMSGHANFGTDASMTKARTDPSGQETIIPGPYFTDTDGGRMWTTAVAGGPYIMLPSGAGGPGTENIIGNYTYRCIDGFYNCSDLSWNQTNPSGWNSMLAWVKKD